ncbi:carbohydrate esterase family 1 protein [Aulographum hederae CBS 113979]|uniref:Carboxylic ester hydrolase n=1 Tax=Aulographum hederae CBS 113979 TaxID=1176131 RepID=A0A6G1H4P7_9PEZI|nr:carbohydrate esterase family 1 protein [Aulographum hederae CBS 113979]
MLLLFLAATVLTYVAHAASLVPVADFGANPTNIAMNIYVPDKLAASPPVVVLLHGCMSAAQSMWRISRLSTFADQKGFIVIVPGTTKDFNCWEVNTAKGLKHGGGGDADGIVNMVKWTLAKYNGDPKKVFSTGISSGGMMTNVLAATYPDVFAAGAVFSGVPAGCLAGSKGASPITADPACADGQIRKTGEEWGAQVRDMYPGYQGSYPRMQIWHGTADSLVTYPNMVEALKEWSFIHGVQFAKNTTDTPQRAYTQMMYGDGTQLVGYSAQGVGHTVPLSSNQQTVLDFFGI